MQLDIPSQVTFEMIFYHSSLISYNVGEIIPPGNWGRGYDGYDPAKTRPGDWLMLARELLFEKVRCEKFPHKPSRFECVFTCQILSDFDIFIDKYNRTSGYRYEVELIDPSLPSHVGDYTLCHWQHGVTYKDLKDVANKYWSGVDIVGREFLTMSALKVVKVL